MSEIDCLFVYGTPQQGHCNFRVVEKLVGRASRGWRVRGTLFDLGRYPGLVLDGGGEVRGELLESGEIGELLRVTDEIEGNEYERVEVTAVSESLAQGEPPFRLLDRAIGVGPGPQHCHLPLKPRRRFPGGRGLGGRLHQLGHQAIGALAFVLEIGAMAGDA